MAVKSKGKDNLNIHCIYSSDEASSEPLSILKSSFYYFLKNELIKRP